MNTQAPRRGLIIVSGPAQVEPNPYSPYADADPAHRHIFAVPRFIEPFAGPPTPATLATTGCGRVAVVPSVPVEVLDPRLLPPGICPQCAAAMIEDCPRWHDSPAHPCPSCTMTTRHDGLCALCRQHKHDVWQAQQPGLWRQMASAPTNGTEIIGLVYDEPIRMRWAEERKCMLAGLAPGAGLFGAGWEDTLDHLVIFEEAGPVAWLPLDPHAENEARA